MELGESCCQQRGCPSGAVGVAPAKPQLGRGARDINAHPGAVHRKQPDWAQTRASKSQEQLWMGKWGISSTSGFSQNMAHIASASETLQELVSKADS